MPRTSVLSAPAVAALRSATATADRITLNTPGLDRDVYLEVDKTLKRIAGGGKWNRSAKAHLFTRDPRAELAALLGDDEPVMPVDRDKELSYFATPADVAEQLVYAADLGPGDRVLEPSAGDGALVRAVLAAEPDARVYAVEPDLHRWEAVKATTAALKFRSTFEDFVDRCAGPRSLRFDAIVMNPPFTLPGRSLAWVEHITAAWDLVTPGGRLAAIAPNSFVHRDTKAVTALRALVDEHGWYEELPDDAFATSGTGVRTVLIAMTRPAD